ncbi:hypothetical protein [Streptomyces sp. SPB162]|uniref:hypothetical protein n=1 Tax=Streptomyces sp. SPB162 TaxID=2940560 RepID=UPI002405E29A|nr:hypothetical protein [Streptomyces sp. SPB162]MDF9816756.1 uncharacterized protein YcbX [Streptomyces sp. SPB162]
MNPDPQRELIPRDDTLRLIGALDGMKAMYGDAAQQWQLLDDAGRVPASPSYPELIQHAVDAQALSHRVIRTTAEFARTMHSTNRAGSAVLAHLATAATLSTYAAPLFAETAQTALSLSQTASSTRRQYQEDSMVLKHATGRSYLRRTSESLHDAAKELDQHLDLHRFFPTLSRRQRPVPPPPKPGTHNL